MDGPVWLDSSGTGRFDIISAAPLVQLAASHSECAASFSNGELQSFENIWDAIDKLLPNSEIQSNWPFIGGILGFWGYEANHQYLNIPIKEEGFVHSRLGLYLWSLIVDHESKTAQLVSGFDIDLEHIAKIFQTNRSDNEAPKDWAFTDLETHTTPERYYTDLDTIKDGILAGTFYQVNYAQCFSGDFKGDTLSLYKRLRQSVVAPYSAYLQYGSETILSLSPERFIKVRDHQVITQPIKGTAPRDGNPDQDIRNKVELQHSDKNRAENLMIVDLMRNDISKVCELGSVTTPELFELHSFSHVHHLISTVRGQLLKSESPAKLLKSCFPGGSITGAPKLSAMKCIEDLEPISRKAYCGSIGYISVHGRMDTNIAIRTLQVENERLYCWGGGGITIDSQPKEEFQETLDKIGAILNILNSKDA